MAAGCRREQPVTLIGDLDAVKMLVAQDGVYRVTLARLQESGLGITRLDPRELQLTLEGEQVPYAIEDEALIFYGVAPEDRYAAAHAYVLHKGREGSLMEENDASPSGEVPVAYVAGTVRAEENLRYLAETTLQSTEDPWFWQTLSQGQKVTLSLDLPEPGPEPASLQLRLWGTTHNPQVNEDHDFDLYVNGRKVTTVRWEGRTFHTANVEIPAGVLRRGNNEIVLDNEPAGASFLDIMELDWLEVSHFAVPAAADDVLRFGGADGDVTMTGFSGRPVVLDVSQPEAPSVLVGWDMQDHGPRLAVRNTQQIIAVGPAGFLPPVAIQPLQEAGLRDAGSAAEFIIITTRELAPALTPLIDARESQGIRTRLITVDEVADEFGHGILTPQALREFLGFAFRSWSQPRPKYVLIVGDATSDYRDYLGIAPRNLVPAPMVSVAYGGETVSDSRLVDVEGDVRPEMAVGRWPVDSVEAVEGLVSRTLSYEQATAAGTALFAADGTETEFAAAAERLMTDAGLSQDEARLLVGVRSDQVVDAWNEGAWLATYIGHGSVERWGKEDIFFPEAVKDLGGSNPPIVLQLTCLTGLFAHPQLLSISEAMLLHDRGPVLLIAATSLTLSADQETFARPLLQQLRDPAVRRIGDAFLSAKRTLDTETSSALREISDTYVLLGDPTAAIVRPQP